MAAASGLGIRRMIVSTYQAVSGAGVGGIRELNEQMKALSEGSEIPAPQTFQYPIACNLIPQIGGFNDQGYSSEEMKMQNEGRKIMHLPQLRVNCTCVRVPVMRSHSESITIEFEREVDAEQAERCCQRPAYASSTILRTAAIRCRWKPAIRISSSWDACVRTSPMTRIIP